MQPEKRTITLRLDPEKHRRLKVALARRGKSIQMMVEDYVDRWLEANDPQGSTPEAAAPEPRRKGGPDPKS
jgi:hypothetical protein